MTRVYVVGVGMTPFGKLVGSTVKSLTRQAVAEALTDGQLSVADVRGAFFSNTTQSHMEGQLFIRGQIALREMGFEGAHIVNVENACASGATALHLATQFLRAGEGDISLSVGVEKMYSNDKGKMFSVFDSGWDISCVEENAAKLLALGEGVAVPSDWNSGRPHSMFMDVYAAFTRFHMREFGTTPRQIASVAAKNHRHSVHNEKAQYRTAYTVDEILSAPRIVYPLTLPMCAPISDGAAAVVLATEVGIKRLGLDRKRAVEVKACIVQTGVSRLPQEVGKHVSALAARRAYEVAGVGPRDISVAEVHDATATGEVIQVENLGFCAFGEGGLISERGETSIGGRIPVNPSGGLESKGHPIGASGLGQIYELVTQLRGEAGARQVEGARHAVAENGGGLYGIEEAVAAVTILAR